MERNTGIGEFRLAGAPGFTLIELLIVVSIIGILATLAAPSYQTSVVKAREAALRQDLFTLRDVLDQHRADQGKYPASLGALVSAGYLRAIPTAVAQIRANLVVPMPLAHLEFGVEFMFSIKCADRLLRIQHFETLNRLNVAGSDFAFLVHGERQFLGLVVLTVQFEFHFLEIQDDVGHVLNHSGQRGELVLRTSNFYRGDRCAFK